MSLEDIEGGGKKYTVKPFYTSWSMKWFKFVPTIILAATVPAWCGSGQGKPLTFDPALLDSTLGKSEKPEKWQGVTKTKKEPPKTHYFLPTGFTFPARLENAIYSYNVESPAIAIVEKDIEYLKKTVIPAGTRVIGTVSVQQDHDRILITFHTMVSPKEGDEIHIQGIALMLDGSAGVKGNVETHKDATIASTVLRSVISGAGEALTISGASPVAAQAAQGLSGEATSLLDTQRQQVTTSISVDADTGLRIYLSRRIEY